MCIAIETGLSLEHQDQHQTSAEIKLGVYADSVFQIPPRYSGLPSARAGPIRQRVEDTILYRGSRPDIPLRSTFVVVQCSLLRRRYSVITIATKEFTDCGTNGCG